MSNLLSRPYRPGVGIMLLNPLNQVFIARRLDFPSGDWQMPQGGINEGETPEEAVLRELFEETSIKSVEILAESRQWRTYDLPDHLADKLWQGAYRGQKQKWFLARFTGEDSEINLETHIPEFCDWKWTSILDLPGLAVYFKRESYKDIIDEFLPYL